jgi:hypothetical protein
MNLGQRFRAWIWRTRYAVWLEFCTRDTFPGAYKDMAAIAWRNNLDWHDGDVRKALECCPMEAAACEAESWRLRSK